MVREADFRAVELNLRESFRILAESRERGDTLEMPGVSIASVGARFQMFNAAFLNGPVATAAELDERLATAAAHFRSRDMRWSFWFCESWLAAPVLRILGRRCERASLRLSSEMPGMVTRNLTPSTRRLPDPEYRLVDNPRTLADFQALGTLCFHVPMLWFSEVFDSAMPSTRSRFRCHVAYLDGLPVATAASVRNGETVGLYNIATHPSHRKRGLAEAITRYAVADAGPADLLVLQSSSDGNRLYERLGFRSVTRIAAYCSIP